MDTTIPVALLMLIGSTLNALFLQLAFDAYVAITRRIRSRDEKNIDAPHYMKWERSQVTVVHRASATIMPTAETPPIPNTFTEVDLDRPYRTSQAAGSADLAVEPPTFPIAYFTAMVAFFVYLLIFVSGMVVLTVCRPDIVTTEMTSVRIVAQLAILFAAFMLTIFVFKKMLRIQSLPAAYMITLNYYLIMIAVAILVYLCRPMLIV